MAINSIYRLDRVLPDWVQPAHAPTRKRRVADWSPNIGESQLEPTPELVSRHSRTQLFEQGADEASTPRRRKRLRQLVRRKPTYVSTVITGSTQASDPLAAARARGEQAKRDLLAVQGEMLTDSEVSARLGYDVDGVGALRRQGLLIALPDEEGHYGFPAWQFTDRGLLPGLQDVLANLGAESPWTQAAFFFSGDIRLDWRTPLEVLLRGDIDAVRRAAAAFGEQVPA